MSDLSNNKTCLVIGASHAGVNLAFALRREGWPGKIILYDTDTSLPYHRPPLSKTYLSHADSLEKNVLKSAQSYVQEQIDLQLGVKVESINREKKSITLEDGSRQSYDKLVIATGARAFLPPISGMDTAKHLYSLRTAEDALHIRNGFQQIDNKNVVVIGGGYIGLEIAASLKKMGGEVTILEREERVLSRVSSEELSSFFEKLHTDNGVQIFTNKNVAAINTTDTFNEIICSDGARFTADMIIVGVGIRVNEELAAAAGLEIKNGIKVDATARTNDPDIFAIGDCTYHHNPHYDCHIRLESVQNAVDQAKVAAAAICGREVTYDSIPWFWSDQYQVKLQIVGLSQGYNEVIIREEKDKDNCFSLWYFNLDRLLAVAAINHGKAYVLGSKLIKSGQQIDKSKLADPLEDFKPANLLLTSK